MRDHNKIFCRLVAEAFDCPDPVFEFGSYQVEGQVRYADLRDLFPGRAYVGCDLRPGPGVDRVEDVSALSLADGAVGTVLSIETFEHVFEVRRAFDEVYRVLRPGGLFVLTCPLNFRIHDFPEDYWRMTPQCLRRLLEPYGGRLVGHQGHARFPHTVMALAIKGAPPADFAARCARLTTAYHRALRRQGRDLALRQKVRRHLARVYRSGTERAVLVDYDKADFTIELAPDPSATKVG